MSLYAALKYIHILSAVIAFGTNITYAFWLTRAEKNPEALTFTLRTVKIIDDWIANPAYVLLFPTGWWLASLAGWPLTMPWILTALILYAVLSIVGLAIYSPTLKKQIALAESVGPESPEYKKVSFRSSAIGIFLNILALIIIYLMVAKPVLWG
ncbi:MAG: DUF2269 domain-containing protein [Chloroflexi bacterium]|nr:DUF2269 domain-containing protein [Chloroflexota bacterium]